MHEEVDVDATYRIPVSSVVKAAVKEAEERKEVAPAVVQDQAPAQPTPSATISVAQAAPVQTVPVSSFVSVHYATEATCSDRELYAELSAVSDEVLACRDTILSSVC